MELLSIPIYQMELIGYQITPETVVSSKRPCLSYGPFITNYVWKQILSQWQTALHM